MKIFEKFVILGALKQWFTVIWGKMFFNAYTYVKHLSEIADFLQTNHGISSVRKSFMQIILFNFNPKNIPIKMVSSLYNNRL